MRLARDTLLVFRRNLRLSLRQPVWLTIGLVQPLIYLCLFGPLLESVAEAPGYPRGDPWQVFVPGLLVQLGLFGTMFVGFGLLRDVRDGVLERLRVTPVSRAALLLGRVMRDLMVLLVQGAALLGAGVLWGLRTPLWTFAVGLGVLALVGAAFSAGSYALALIVRNEDTVASTLNLAGIPLLLLSGILLPMSLAPDWLQAIADANPLRHVVDGARELFLHGGGPSVVPGVAAAAGMAFVFAALAAWALRRESR